MAKSAGELESTAKNKLDSLVETNEATLPAEPVARLGDVLHRVALTVNSSLDLKEVLKQLGEIALDAIPADRCHFFLLDDGGTKLIPKFSAGRVTDIEQWRRFKAMEPIDLKEVPARWEAFRAGRALAITDMASSPIVPKRIVRLFRSRSALVAMLEVNNERLGVFSLDWVEQAHEFSIEEIQLIEAIGAYAALAVRNARLYEGLEKKARTLERLVEVAAALNTSTQLRSVLEMICDAFEELLGTIHCSVNTLDEALPGGVRTLAVTGEEWFTAAPEKVPAISPKEITRVGRVWKGSSEPVLYPDLEQQSLMDRSLIPSSVRSAALFPLAASGRLFGFVLAGFPELGGPGSEALEYGQALADQAATALDQVSLRESVQKRLRQVEILNRLSDVVTGASKIQTALRTLNRFLTPELGIRLEAIFVPNKKLREAVGAKVPGKEEMEAIRSWRASISRPEGRAPLRSIDKAMLVPVVRGSRVQGALRVSIDRVSIGKDAPHEDFLGAIAGACAEVLYKAGLRKALAENERRLAVESERDRIARDLHDSVGHILTAMGMRLIQLIPEAPDETWREHLEQLKRQSGEGLEKVRESIESLLFLDVRKLGLLASLKDLSNQFEATTGIEINLRVDGKPARLGAPQEDALFRIAHEALANVERHSRASFVTLALGFRPRQASMTVRDDGVGLAHRDPFNHRRPGHYGLRGLQRLVGEMGGELRVQNAAPRGVIVEAKIPIGAGSSGREHGVNPSLDS